MLASSGKRRNTPDEPIFPPMGPGAFGRLRRSPLEVSGTTAQLAAIRHAKIAAVKSVNI
jgi:hypothetical protein